MKILIDKNIPYIEHFFADYLDQIEYFSDNDFQIEKVKEDSVVVLRSTYKTHGKKIPNSIKFLCSASTGEDHIDKERLDKMKIPYAFSTGANAIAVKEYFLSVLALMLKEGKFNKRRNSILVIGCGNIGDSICKILYQFEFSFCVSDPFVDHEWDDFRRNDQKSTWNDTSLSLRSWNPSLIGTLYDFIDMNVQSYGLNLITIHVPLVLKKKHSTKNLLRKKIFERLPDGAIIINTSRGGVVSEKDFMELDSNKDYIRLISDVFENEPNVNNDFLEKNLFGTPHIAGHSQYARYEMTKMAYEHVVNFLGYKNIDRDKILRRIYLESILENKIVFFDKNIFDQDMKEFGLPVSLMLDTYNPKLDHFECGSFKNIRDKYNHRIGYSQVIIKGCDDVSDKIALEKLGFTVEDS